MARVIITLKAMMASPEVDLKKAKEVINKKIENFGGEPGRVIEEKIAFGLIALNFIFILDEEKGSTDSLEEDISSLDYVSSVQVADVRRAIG